MKPDRMLGVEYHRPATADCRSEQRRKQLTRMVRATPCYYRFFDLVTSHCLRRPTTVSGVGRPPPPAYDDRPVKAISTASDPPASSGYCFPFRRRRCTISKITLALDAGACMPAVIYGEGCVCSYRCGNKWHHQRAPVPICPLRSLISAFLDV